ncbi:MAG: metallophosphoesterase [Bacteroidetes bacterium]|nr:metallophosphoesterase [Bacteroidota bacterium]
MKILCVADSVDLVVYSQNIKERFKDVSFVIGAGDLKMRYYGFIVSMLNKPLYFIFGNHDLKFLKRFKKKDTVDYEQPNETHYYKNYFGSTYISDKVVRDKKTGLILAGLGGSMKYNRGENQYSNSQMYAKIFRLFPKLLFNRIFHGRWVDILVTHAPPFGIHDGEDACHTGFKAFLWFMRKFQPEYLLHGHVHLLDINQKRESVYENTQVINVYSRYILEFETK